MWLILSGFFVHLVLLISVFDIYFKTPIIHGIVPYTISAEAPAKRLVLYVADGLRADSFFKRGSNEPNTKFLRSIIEDTGSWGVSHTRVPTESRPGHVALIAGFYEDPSAIAKGWKENPVEFDSVFNQSRFTWSWGSPDILPMFAKGATGNHVYVDMYDANDEDFSGAHSTTKLDIWVFDKVHAFLESAKLNRSLYEKLQNDKIVFFLHLLGLDTAGHTHKPHSEEYGINLQIVDDGIQNITQLIEEFYNYDGQTAFVFTADHGMTDWGSHGAGDQSETETPLVAWGSGISGPKPTTSDHPNLCPDSWNLGHLLQRDVEQADIAPLMSSLIGIPIPVNSVGSLPIDLLNVSQNQLSEAVFSNANQITAQFRQKREIIEFGTLKWLYQPYKALTREKETDMLQQIRNSITVGNHNYAIARSQELMTLGLDGLEYYQNYYQCLLLSCVSMTFIGWIIWLLLTLLPTNSNMLAFTPKSQQNGSGVTTETWSNDIILFLGIGGYIVNIAFLLFIIITIYLIYVQLLPPQFYVYCLLPELIWWAVCRQHRPLLKALTSIHNTVGFGQLLAYCLVFLMGIEIMVLSFFYRFVLSAGVIGLILWPLTSAKPRSAHWALLTTWFSSCAALAIFPQLPVVGRDANLYLVSLSGYLWFLLGVMFACRRELHIFFDRRDSSRSTYATLLQLAMLLIAVWNLQATSTSFKNKEGLPAFNQILSWVMFGMSFILSLSSSQGILARLLSVSLGLAIPFLLLCVNHEGFFLLTLTVNLFCWLGIEHHCSSSKDEKLTELSFHPPRSSVTHPSLNSSDFRRAFFFLFYIIISFFGTGNVASINSFDPAWVRCFLAVFSPFAMTILILWKTMVPFLVVTCMFHAVNVVIQTPITKLFLIVLVFCDTMGLHFLHLVTNQGSWLDIGTSISHYVIMQLIVLFLVLLYGVAKVLTGVTLFSKVDHQHVSSLIPQSFKSKNDTFSSLESVDVKDEIKSSVPRRINSKTVYTFQDKIHHD